MALFPSAQDNLRPMQTLKMQACPLLDNKLSGGVLYVLLVNGTPMPAMPHNTCASTWYASKPPSYCLQCSIVVLARPGQHIPMHGG